MPTQFTVRDVLKKAIQKEVGSQFLDNNISQKASTIAAGDGRRMPSENELAITRFQGHHVAAIAKKLAGK